MLSDFFSNQDLTLDTPDEVTVKICSSRKKLLASALAPWERAFRRKLASGYLPNPRCCPVSCPRSEEFSLPESDMVFSIRTNA